MKTKMMLLLAGIVFLSSCSTMNSELGCDQTAGDSCLTIDEVNAMTEPKGMYQKEPVYQRSEIMERKKDMAGTIWIAPHKNNGRLMPERRVALNDRTQEA